MLPASAAATAASNAAAAKDNDDGLIGDGGASSAAMIPPPPSSSPAPPGGFQASRPRLNGGGGRLLPMLHHQRLGLLPILQGDKGGQQLELHLVVNSLCFPIALPLLPPNPRRIGQRVEQPNYSQQILVANHRGHPVFL